MLGTLMKHELKAVGRLLLPLYGAWLVAAVMLGMSIGNTADSGSPMFIALSGLLYGGATMIAIVLTCILLIQRFYKNLLGNEGYLMFALPVSTSSHMINKTLSGAIWGTAGVIVAVISGLLIAGCIEGFGNIFDNIYFFVGDVRHLMANYPSTPLIFVEVLLIVFFAFAETAAKVYAAIAVGHQWSNHRVMGAIAAYIGFGIIEGIIANIIDKIFDSGLENAFYSITEDWSGLGEVHLTMVFVILMIAVVTAIYWFVAWKLLDKKLNLE